MADVTAEAASRTRLAVFPPLSPMPIIELTQQSVPGSRQLIRSSARRAAGRRPLQANQTKQKQQLQEVFSRRGGRAHSRRPVKRNRLESSFALWFDSDRYGLATNGSSNGAGDQ
jgi:hypothetical protein